MKKWLSMILTVVLVLCVFAGCGGDSGGKNSGGGSKGPTKVTFPLEKKVEYTFMVNDVEDMDFKKNIANNKFWNELEQKTNVHINFQFLGTNGSEGLARLISGGDYGDVLWGGPIINSAEASKYIASNKFADLTDYIIPDIMPNLCKIIEDRPDVRKMITAADGRIYILPKITDLEGWYLEGPIMVNKRWLDNLGLGIPKTLDEFTNMLRAFSEKDPNGNGLYDEIPFLASTASDYMNMEVLLGLWGVPTKDATNDSFVMVKDGKVKFVPTDPAYKEYLKYMATLYKEKLLWNDCFTANANTINSLITADTCMVGCFTVNSVPNTPYMDDYICIAPPKVEGYEPCWFMNCGINGAKNMFFATDKCKDLSVLLAWVDQLFTVDSAMRVDYGEPGEGRYTIDENGKYTFVELDSYATEQLNEKKPTLNVLIQNSIRAFTKDGFDKINLSKSWQAMQNNYQIYKDVVNKEIWPRPYISANDAFEADTYTTDIFYQVTTYRGECITGNKDVDKTWDNYVKKINSLHLKEYINILQRSYDAVWKD